MQSKIWYLSENLVAHQPQFSGSSAEMKNFLVVISVIFRNRITTAILLQTQSPDLRKEGREEKQEVLKEKTMLVKNSGTRSLQKDVTHSL